MSEKLEELKTVNSEINKKITYKTDKEYYDKIEFWEVPKDGFGDCEDYALMKLRRLLELDWDIKDLSLCAVKTDKRLEHADHAILVVHLDKELYSLDNRYPDVWTLSRTGYEVEMIQMGGTKSWVTLEKYKEEMGLEK